MLENFGTEKFERNERNILISINANQKEWKNLFEFSKFWVFTFRYLNTGLRLCWQCRGLRAISSKRSDIVARAENCKILLTVIKSIDKFYKFNTMITNELVPLVANRRETAPAIFDFEVTLLALLPLLPLLSAPVYSAPLCSSLKPPLPEHARP